MSAARATDAATKPSLLVITGPTASGKTALALALARQLDGELIGADSVQVYRGMDIGSGKPTQAELLGIAHHLIDIRDPDQPLDAVGFAALADAAIASVASRHKLPIVVGGSGLWLRALLRGLVELPSVDPALRERLTQEAEAHGTAALHARLKAVDEIAAREIHPHDRVRVVRALEVFEQTGRPVGELRRQHALGAPRYRALRMVIDPGPDALTARIRERTRTMLEMGFVAETEALVARYGPELRALGSVGYREVVAHLQGRIPLEQLEESIVRATRIYARRQRTWLNNEPGEIVRTHAEDVLSDAGLRGLRAWLADS